MSIDELKRSIEKERIAINNGGGCDYQDYRNMQKEYASWLLQFCSRALASGHKLIDIHRSDLRLIHKSDFPKGTVLVCAGYKIWCDAGKTYATKRMRVLNDGNMPQFIHRFVF